jgi:hypothetical protein
MDKKPATNDAGNLPRCTAEYIRQVCRKMRYRRKTREDVRAELTAHFEDELRDCTRPEEREQRAQQLIGQFGDAKLLAVLCRRAKKRCRPLWCKALVRSTQVLGAFILYSLICSLPLFLGKPTVRVNYADWLSERWRPAQTGLQNAKQYYDRAAKLYVKAPEALDARRNVPEWTVRDCNEADLQLLGGWLAENKPAFDLLRKGASTADYWPVYDVNEGYRNNVSFLWMEANVVPQTMERLARYKQVVRALNDRIDYQARQGVIREAVDDSLVILRFGRHLEGKGLLIDQLVGIAIEALGRSAMFDILEKRDVSLEVLSRVQDELGSTLNEDRRIIDLEGEKVFWYDNIQRTFTDDGHGGGHVLRHGLPFAAGDWRSNLSNILRFDYPDRREAIAMVDAYFSQAQETLYTPPNKNEPSPEGDERAGTPKLNLLLSVAVPAYERLAQLAWRAKTGEAALATTLAILRYRAEKGSYPARLEDLVQAGFLARLPEDPFGKGPLTYSKTADGFRLYSWGENLVDDGGRQGTGRDGAPRMWTDNGDWVFWPVSRVKS